MNSSMESGNQLILPGPESGAVPVGPVGFKGLMDIANVIAQGSRNGEEIQGGCKICSSEPFASNLAKLGVQT